MSNSYLPPSDFLRECFSYDPLTGIFLWRHRPEHHFEKPHLARTWNARLAGSPAFGSRGKGGYAQCEVAYEGRRVRLRASRVAYKIITGEEHYLIDHKNQIPDDDRFSNLRVATPVQNNWNVSGRPSKVLPKGVHFAKGRFSARIALDGRKLHLGVFNSPSEAHAAYCAKAITAHGTFFNPGPRRDTIWD